MLHPPLDENGREGQLASQRRCQAERGHSAQPIRVEFPARPAADLAALVWRWQLSGAKPEDANTVRVLTILRVDKNVQPCLFDESVWILHEPYRLTVIAHQDQALRQPFGVTHAGAAAETLCDTRLVPRHDVGTPATFVAVNRTGILGGQLM